MTLLASVLFPSLVLAAAQVGCSSNDNGNAAPPPFDSGTVTVPEASTGAGAVTITVSGKGYVVSQEGVQQDGGPNGFVGPDGGAPLVDCPAACTAPKGTIVYAYATPGNAFVGWTVAGGEAGTTTLDTHVSFTISSATPSPLVATFAPEADAAPAPPPPPPTDAGGGG